MDLNKRRPIPISAKRTQRQGQMSAPAAISPQDRCFRFDTRIQDRMFDAKLAKNVHRVRAHLQPGAHFAQLFGAFPDLHLDTVARQRQRYRKPADTGARNDRCPDHLDGFLGGHFTPGVPSNFFSRSDQQSM